MKCCKIVVGLITAVILGVWGYLVYDINAAYPSPDEIAYRIGDTFEYYGVEITPKSVEIYDYDQMVEMIPELADYIDVEGEYYWKSTYYIMLTMHAKNVTGADIPISKNPVSGWMLEVGIEANGQNSTVRDYLVPIKNMFSAGWDGEIQIPYRMPYNFVNGMSEEDMINEGIKIVISYYPDKQYILYKGETE